MQRIRLTLALTGLLYLGGGESTCAEDRATLVRRDRDEYLARGSWIYNDLDRGFATARKTGKPILVVLRCIPCESCRGFDEQVGSSDARIRKLLDRFVRVRIPKANSLDLSLFQFDYDLSFFAFFLNADRTIYGRFGSPSTQKDKKGDVSVEAFTEAMEAALELHASFDRVKDSLRGKAPVSTEYRVPEEHPELKGKYRPTLDYQGNVVKSCIHCHQIRDSERIALRKQGQPVPDEVLHPWPLPEVFGVHLDPRRRAHVARVDEGSVAARAGFLRGDDLVALEGQPLISIADAQWVLHNTGDEGELEARVRRGEKVLTLKLPLRRGWRRKSDISWRVTTWDLRRMTTGGLLLEALPAGDPRRSAIDATAMALLVKHAGQYGEHGTAMRAGVRKGDIITSLDGRIDILTETAFIAHGMQKKRSGDEIELSIRRGDKGKTIRFRLR